jgi:hypothetical protein
MNRLIRSTAVAAALAATLATAPALADAPKLPMRAGDVATPSALATGEEYLSISKTLKCENSSCTATIKGRKKKQTLITQISCVTVTDTFQVSYGAATAGEASDVALAIFPVQSRAVAGTTEYGVVGGPTQIVLGPEDSFFFGVVATGEMQQAICTLTGTTTKL